MGTYRKNKKKAQTSIFIIIGIVVLVSTAILFYSRSTSLRESVNTEILVTEKIAKEIEPLREYVHTCMEKTGKRAIKMAAMQGGYIDPEDEGLMGNPYDQSESDIVYFRKGSFAIPYWWYSDSSVYCSGDCSFTTNKPHLLESVGSVSIEEQILDYVEENLDFCLNEFKPFKKQGFDIFSIDEIEFEAQITKSDFRIKLDMPLRITLENREHRISEFGVIFDVNFRKIYELAETITEAQAQYGFLERQLLNMIAAFSDIDKDMLPPLGQVNFEPKSPVYWSKSDVEATLKSIISSYIPLFQIPGTNNYMVRDTGNDIGNGLYQLFDLPIYSPSGYSYSDISVDFKYNTWWNHYFDITGRGVSGALIGPEQGFFDVIPQVVIQRYNNNYQVSFPVIVEINDIGAFNGEGLSFFFALEGNIRNNKAMNSSYEFPKVAIPQVGSMLCNANQRNSAEIQVIARDSITGRPLNDVQVSFICGTELCSMGYTFDEGKGAQYNDRFPVCAGGLIKLTKEGYSDHYESITTRLEEDESDPEVIDIDLEKIYDLNLVVMKRRFMKSGDGSWTYNPDPMGLLDNEVAMISLKEITEKGDGHSEVAFFRANESSRIKIAPGKYEVDINLIYELPAFGYEYILFPEEKKSAGPIWGKEEITIPEVQFNGSFFEGGARLNSETGYVLINRATLDRSESVIFYTLSPLDFVNFRMLSHEDLQRMGMIEEFSKEHYGDLKPVFG